jgi:hypothetical protein
MFADEIKSGNAKQVRLETLGTKSSNGGNGGSEATNTVVG